jgi:hypothetical protein
MPKKAEELKDKAVRAIVNANVKGRYAVGRVSGLVIQVIPPDAASWILRTTINGKRKEIGLGGYPEISLSVAREKALELKSKIDKEDFDPVESKRSQRSQAKKEQFKTYTFDQLAKEYIEKRSCEFKTQQQVRKLTNMISSYASPTLGNMFIKDIDLNTIKKVLDPIWKTKTETASRLRIYISHIFDTAIARGIYTELNPARWDGGLKTIFSPPHTPQST